MIGQIDTHNILIVDNTPGTLIVIENALSDNNVNIFMAESCKKALCDITQNDITLTIINVNMPELESFDTIKLFKENKKGKSIPLIFVDNIDEEELNMLKDYTSGSGDNVQQNANLIELENNFNFLFKPKIVEIAKKDVTDSLRFKSDRFEKENTFLKILNAIASGVCIINEDYKFEYINDLLVDEFGDVNGQTCYEYFTEGSSLCDGCNNDSVSLEQICRTEVFSAKSGKTYDRITKLINVENMMYKLMVFNDITKYKYAENALICSTGELVHNEKLFATAKLAASVAHELSNPITGIRSVLENISTVDFGKKEEDYKDLVTIAIKECDRINRLIKNLHDLNRTSPEIIEIVDVNEITDAMVIITKNKLEDKGIILEKNYGKEIPTIKAVPDQIKQVVLNLLQNAEDSIIDKGQITITTQHIESNVIIAISDTGEGINDEEMKHIFDPFFTTKPFSKGTGLGLSVSSGIIQKHNGKIEVESEQGKGSTFKIILPQTEVFDRLTTVN